MKQSSWIFSSIFETLEYKFYLSLFTIFSFFFFLQLFSLLSISYYNRIVKLLLSLCILSIKIFNNFKWNTISLASKFAIIVKHQDLYYDFSYRPSSLIESEANNITPFQINIFIKETSGKSYERKKLIQTPRLIVGSRFTGR